MVKYTFQVYRELSGLATIICTAEKRRPYTPYAPGNSNAAANPVAERGGKHGRETKRNKSSQNTRHAPHTTKLSPTYS